MPDHTPIPSRLRPIFLAAIGLLVTATRAVADDAPPQVSGRYPHLAMYNRQGECGTGAVVPWSDRLWVITYAPHQPKGSDDKLYEIDADLKRIVRPESVGGTPADRMIHAESKQLIIGPYFIDEQRNVRVVTPEKMPGRLTAAAQHLSEPANKVYVFDMEGALYEIDVHTLAVSKLFNRVAPGAHGKGAYTGQGRFVIANNGNIVANKTTPTLGDPAYAKDPEAAGALAEWDGKSWKMLERRSFTDITGPGGINGSPDDKSPLWAIGWDKRSVMLKLLDGGKWQNFRLPIADYSHAAKHGWYTEWPRIREVGNGKLLMNMHGGWYDFPKAFSAARTDGIRPLGSHLKITGDFCAWNGKLVFGCDDASILNNPLLAQSQSNLWFSSWEGLSQCGLPSGDGGPWLNDSVKAGEPSAPYLLAGYEQRVVHLSNGSDHPANFTLEVDANGKGSWANYKTIAVAAHGYEFHVIPADVKGEWVRVKTDVDCEDASAYFHYGPGGGRMVQPELFASLAGPMDRYVPATVRPLGEEPGSLWIDTPSLRATDTENVPPMEMTAELKLRPYSGKVVVEPKSIGAADDYAVRIDERSVVVTEGKKRYRLPLSSDVGLARPIREVVTERFLLNAGGSFYMLPYPSAGGASRIKPICTHDKRISDFCSWRGLMVLAGAKLDAKPHGHYFAAEQSGPGVWLGDIDDLWKMGKPRGHGGPWLNTLIEQGVPSDPYLLAGYDQKALQLSHDAVGMVQVTLEVDIAANGTWSTFKIFEVPAGQTVKYQFPTGYSAQWLRARCYTACRATLQLTYE